MVIELCSEEDNPAKVYDVLEDTSAVTATSRDLLEDIEYTIKVSILVNGKVVSSVSKDLKDIEKSGATKMISEQHFCEESSEEMEQLMDTTPLLLV